MEIQNQTAARGQEIRVVFAGCISCVAKNKLKWRYISSACLDMYKQRTLTLSSQLIKIQRCGESEFFFLNRN